MTLLQYWKAMQAQAIILLLFLYIHSQALVPLKKNPKI